MCDKKYLLKAPKEYFEMLKNDPKKLKELVNGCGPKFMFFGIDLGDSLVPDTIYGLNVCKACSPHDMMYSYGKSLKDKEIADRIFLENLYRIIEAGTKWGWLKNLRRKRALKYYNAVASMGEVSFLKATNNLGFGKIILGEI